MKLCPHCEFIYEDDQTVCDMDGRELVYDPGRLSFQDPVFVASPEPGRRIDIELPPRHEIEPPRRIEIPLGVAAGFPAASATKSYFRSSAVVALAAIIFAALLFVVYYAKAVQTRSTDTNPASTQSSVESTGETAEPAPGTAESASALAEVATSSVIAAAEQAASVWSNDATSEQPQLEISSASYNRERMLSNPVSAGSSGADNRSPATIWLTNGSSIKADEAWERRDGVWYRQGGVVTFLKRSQVRSIQRTSAGASGTYAKSTPTNQAPATAIAQNQPRIIKPEPATTKKDSKVGSFLKKTGRILKRPFKL